MNEPKVTPAQGGAVAAFIGGVLAAKGAGLEGAVLVETIRWVGALCVAWIVADAAIRGARNYRASKAGER